MKTAALFFGGLLLSALAAGPAAAEPVRVRLTARVTQISDPGNVLAGKVVTGQRVNGVYVYNTNTPNQSPFPGSGHYQPYANEARVRFAIGSLVFESKQPTQGIVIFINSDTSGSGQFIMDSTDNKPLAGGTAVSDIFLEFRGSGNMTQSGALPTVAPSLGSYWAKEVTITGGSYSVRAQIEASELIVPVTMEVSPAAGSFAANQDFDAALILPRNSTVTTAQATANGHPLPLTYPGSCLFYSAFGAGKPWLLCPGADRALPIAAGAPIEWTVELTDGTILTETVNWEVAP